jgi:HAE1 family hydrophobic/amphiphilic exporter-1
MNLSQFAVRSPVKVAMLFLGIILLGIISLLRLPINLFPDLRSPRITVVVETEALSPSEVERRVVRHLERTLVTISQVRDVTTISRDDSAVGIVEFDWGADMDFALLDVKKAVAHLANDEEIEEVTTYRYDPNEEAIMTLALWGREDLESLYRLAYEALKPELERLEGVAAARVTGGLQPEVLVAVDENLLLYYGFDMPQVVSAIERSTVNASGGWVETGSERLMLKSVGELESLDQLGLTVVGYKGANPVFLSDVAQIEIGSKEIESIVRYNGHPGVGISIHKEADANTVRVVQTVKRELEEYQKSLAEGVTIETAYDQSVFVRTAILGLFWTALVGMGLAVFVLLIFLRSITSTVIIGVAIPISIIATFNLMYFQDLTLNIMTLGGLALGSGMLVDCAVVVLENIYRHRQEGLEKRQAAILGAREVGAAIVASTLTTIVVFLPIVFVRGIAGFMFKEQALTVSYSLLASLVVALLLIPMLCSRFLLVRKSKGEMAGRSLYRRLLGWALRHRLVAVVITVLALAYAVVLFPTIPREFLPKADQPQFVIKLEMPIGTRIEVTDKAVRRIEDLLAPHQAAIRSVYARSGVAPEAMVAAGEEVEGPHTAEISVVLDRSSSQAMSAVQLVDAIAPAASKIPGANIEYQMQQSSLADILGRSGAPVEIEIRGENLAQLTAATERVREALASLPSLYNVRTNQLEGNPQIVLHPDPVRLASLGFDVQSLASALQSRLTGEEVTTYQSERGDMDIRVASSQVEREGLAHLGSLRLRSRRDRELTLGDVCTMDIVRGPREIIRRGQKRIARVMADIHHGKLSDVVGEINQVLEDLPTPGCVVQFSGEEERRRESFRRLGFALILAVVLVYMVIASILESLIHPFTIMLSVPLAAVGVVVALVLSGETLNLMAYIGVVMLAGIVVNNAIVMLDYVNQLRARGMDVEEALLTAGQRRLRPILMTSLTTILALLPLTLGIGEGAQLRRPLAVAVIGGLTSSALLTLVFIPVVYSYLESVLSVFRRLFGRSDDPEQAMSDEGRTMRSDER